MRRYPELRFGLHPASRLLHSTCPVLAIWRLHQANTSPDATVNLDAGDPFAAAAESALTVDPEFNFTVSIRDHLARRTIVDFYF